MRHADELLANVSDLARGFAADRVCRQRRRALESDDIESLKSIGLHLAAVPEEYGGWWQGRACSTRVQCDAIRLLAQGDPSLALVATMHPSVLNFWRDPDPPATGAAAWEAQKREVFGTVLDGAWWGTITSEPGSNGDIARTRARAEPGEGGENAFLLTGEKHFGSGSGATTHMVTTALRPGAESPDWFYLDVRGVPWDGSTGMMMTSPWDGHGMASTNSHGFRFKSFPATRMAWPGRWTEVFTSTGGSGALVNTAPFVGIIEAAMAYMRHEFVRRDQPPATFRAFDKIAWATAHREAWLLYAAFEAALCAIERKRDARHEVALARTNIVVLAESIMTRLCRIAGGGAYSRHSPLGIWFEDVRALGFLRPPWSLAYENLFADSWQGEPGTMSLTERGVPSAVSA